MGKFNDRTGEKIGRLYVIERAPDSILPSGLHKTMWKCRCDCGNIVTVRADSLTGNHTLSCGCYQKEVVSRYMKSLVRKVDYGESRERLHNIWYLMHYRCYNSKCSVYKNYGGRGITVCDDWKNIEGYFNFKKWALSNGYQDDLTIERTNVNGNYEPDNCCWIPMRAQASNKRTNRLLTYNGQTLTMAEWSRQSGIPYKTLHNRLHYGWDVDMALTQPVKVINRIN